MTSTLNFLKDKSLSKPFFPLEGKPEEFRLSTDEHERLALLPFEGKQTAPEGQKKAIILWGAPHSGKTSQSSILYNQLDPAERKSIVSVCYDEAVGDPNSGAIFNIEAFKIKHDELTARLGQDISVDKRNEIYNEFLGIYRENRSDSQRIRSLTFNEAVYRGNSVFIDSTASSGGVFKMLNALHEFDYATEVWGFMAPMSIAEYRASLRTKPVEREELYGKRVGAYNTLPRLMISASTVSLYWNPQNGTSPQQFLEIRNAPYSALRNAAIQSVVLNQLRNERVYLANSSDPFAQKNAPLMGPATAGIIEAFESLKYTGFLRPSFSPVQRGALDLSKQ